MTVVAPEDVESHGRQPRSGLQLSLGDYNIKPRDTEFTDKVEPLSVCGCAHFTLILIFHSFFTVIPVSLWTIYFCLTYNSVCARILDALDQQPTGYAALDYDYAAAAAPGTPPGHGPHGGPHVYGHRSDLGDEFAGVPSMRVQHIVDGYYSFGIPGHPNVGMGVIEQAFPASALAGVGTYGFVIVLFVLLYRKPMQLGKKVWISWPLGFAGYVAYSLIEIHNAYEKKGEKNTAKYYFLGYVVISLLIFKFLWKARYVARAIGVNVFLCSMGAFAFPAITKDVLTSGRPEWFLVVFRVIAWPVMEELTLLILRCLLRTIPSDNQVVDKSTLALTLVPIKTVYVLLGRFMMFSLRSDMMIVICNVGLFFTEVAFRTSVGVRDRAVMKGVVCCNQEKFADIFTDPKHKKFRADNTILASMIEYVAMVFGFICVLMLRTTNDPSNISDVEGLLFNFFLQVFLEILCDTSSVYFEVNRQKLPLVAAWKARTPNFAWAFPALVLSMTATTSVVFMESFFCPMRPTGVGGQIVWQYC